MDSPLLRWNFPSWHFRLKPSDPTSPTRPTRPKGKSRSTSQAAGPVLPPAAIGARRRVAVEKEVEGEWDGSEMGVGVGGGTGREWSLDGEKRRRCTET